MAVAAERARPRAGSCSSPPTTSATSRWPPACTPRSPRPAAPGSSSVSSSAHLRSPVVFDDIHFERRPYEPVAGLRPVEDGERAVRRRGDPALGRRRHHRQRAACPGGDPHQPAAPRHRRGPRARCARRRRPPAPAGRPPSRAPPPPCCSPPRRCSTASAAATSRTATRPSPTEPGTRTRRRRVRARPGGRRRGCGRCRRSRWPLSTPAAPAAPLSGRDGGRAGVRRQLRLP